MADLRCRACEPCLTSLLVRDGENFSRSTQTKKELSIVNNAVLVGNECDTDHKWSSSLVFGKRKGKEERSVSVPVPVPVPVTPKLHLQEAY